MLTRTPSETLVPPQARQRDPRLDFFRGAGMLIILIAHIPNNHWTLWIPARFGFSDATEMFVFLSGMASALAFGRLYDTKGPLAMTARVAARVWQIYWTHICVFLLIATMMIVAGNRPDGMSYAQSLNLLRFLDDPAPLLVGLLTLTYVPNYFDILPMYMVILTLLPVMLLLESRHRLAPLALMVLLWIAAQTHLLSLPAEPWTERPWFFNPFGWQLLFFLGFFLMRRTFVLPVGRPAIIALALAVVILTIPFAWFRILNVSPFFHDAARFLLPLTDKTSFGLLRLVHFLSLAVLALALVGPKGERLKGRAVDILRKVGQQSLAVFVTGMVTAQALGILLDHAGRNAATTALANLTGFAVLIACAYIVRWFKTSNGK